MKTRLHILAVLGLAAFVVFASLAPPFRKAKHQPGRFQAENSAPKIQFSTRLENDWAANRLSVSKP